MDVPSPGRSAPGRPPGVARARQRAETRERIFEVALREFREVGVAAARVDRIARAAGVTRGVFYFHFPTKDGVLVELARRVHARAARRVAVLGATDPSLTDLLTRMVDVILDEHSRVGEAGLLADMLALYVRRPHDVRDPRHNVPTLSGVLARQLDALRARGAIQSDQASERIASVFMGSLFGICTRVPHGEALREACGSMVELLVRGLEPRPQPVSPAGSDSDWKKT